MRRLELLGGSRACEISESDLREVGGIEVTENCDQAATAKSRRSPSLSPGAPAPRTPSARTPRPISQVSTLRLNEGVLASSLGLGCDERAQGLGVRGFVVPRPSCMPLAVLSVRVSDPMAAVMSTWYAQTVLTPVVPRCGVLLAMAAGWRESMRGRSVLRGSTRCIRWGWQLSGIVCTLHLVCVIDLAHWWTPTHSQPPHCPAKCTSLCGSLG